MRDQRILNLAVGANALFQQAGLQRGGQRIQPLLAGRSGKGPTVAGQNPILAPMGIEGGPRRRLLTPARARIVLQCVHGGDQLVLVLEQRAGAGALFENENELIAAMHALQHDPGTRRRQEAAARAAFDAHWREDRVLARYGRAFAAAARKKGLDALAAALEAGLLEKGVRTDG